MGNLRGQGAFLAMSWQPRDDPIYPEGGDPFHGPVGAYEFISNDGGSIRPYTNRFYEGNSAEFILEADEGMRISGVLLNGERVGDIGFNQRSLTYVLEEVTRTGRIEAVFSELLSTNVRMEITVDAGMFSFYGDELSRNWLYSLQSRELLDAGEWEDVLTFETSNEVRQVIEYVPDAERGFYRLRTVWEEGEVNDE